MKLMDNIFDYEKKLIKKLNKIYLIVILIITSVLIFTIFIVKRDYYYENIISITDNKKFLVVERKYLNDIKKNKKIYIGDIESNYSVNKINMEEEICFVNISLKPDITIKNNTKYKLLIRKEKIIEYIMRIIKEI